MVWQTHNQWHPWFVINHSELLEYSRVLPQGGWQDGDYSQQSSSLGKIIGWDEDYKGQDHLIPFENF